MSPPAAAATSLVVVTLNAASGSLSYVRGGRVDVRTGLVLAAGTVPGAFVGPWISERTPERAFKLAFATFLVAMAAALLLKPERTAEPAPPAHALSRARRVHRRFTDRAGLSFDYSYSLPVALTLSFLVGILSSMFGVGGGIVHVPAMIHLMGFPVHIATATSFFVLAITATMGVLEYARRDYIVWPLAVAIGLGVVVGAQLGVWVSHRLHGRRIVRLLTLAIFGLAVRLFWDAWRGN